MISLRALLLCLVCFISSVAWGQTETCANSALQSSSLRVVDGKIVNSKKSFDLQVHNQTTNEWRTVLSSIEKIELARLSPDAQYLAYATNVLVRGQVTPWLYLQKVTNGWREVVVVLKDVPNDLCFDSKGASLNLVDPSGTVKAQGLAEQIKLLTRH